MICLADPLGHPELGQVLIRHLCATSLPSRSPPKHHPLQTTLLCRALARSLDNMTIVSTLDVHVFVRVSAINTTLSPVTAILKYPNDFLLFILATIIVQQ